MDIRDKVINYQDWMQDGAPIPKGGIFVLGMPNEEYHAMEGISNSGLSLMHKSPAHYRYQERPETTPAHFMIGTAVHESFLEPELFAEKYIITQAKDKRTKEYKEAVKEYPKHIVLTKSDSEKISKMHDALRHLDFKLPPMEGYAELSAFVHCPETGVLLRVRFDFLTFTGHAVDLKTTADSSSKAFSSSVYKYGYHRQNAMYNDVFELIMGKPLLGFDFAVVESSAPYTPRHYVLDEDSVNVGRYQYKQALRSYAKCMKDDHFPYDGEGEDSLISIPNWAFAEYEDQLEGDIT